MPTETDDHPITPEITHDIGTPADAASVSRRGWGKHLLLGASTLAVLLASGKRDHVQAAPTDPWKLGGNTVATNDSEFLGSTNSASLIIKTSGVERMRVTPTGNVSIGTATASTARLQVDISGGTAVYGRNLATGGSAPAVRGRTSSSNSSSSGVLGEATNTTPGSTTAGVRGVNSSTGLNGVGVYGSHAGFGYGVYGTSPNGHGVVGAAAGGFTAGVQGTHAGEGYGVSGTVTTNAGAAGVSGYHVGDGYGVLGTASGGYGVYGVATYTGVYGTGTTYGVYGTTTTGYGVYGTTSTGTGVKGESTGDGGVAIAIHGKATGVNSTGVWGEANAGASAYGVWGVSTAGYAGYFNGKVTVTGTLSKGAGSFKIDHPLHPDTKYLSHSFVESPDMMNVYTGNVTLDAKGEAVVTMPTWFEALNRDFRYQLTPIGAPGPNLYIAEKMRDNRFKIAGGKPGMEVSWMVTGIRQDAFANANRIPVEEDKPEKERGTYLHPKAFGKPETAGVDAERIANLRQRDLAGRQAPQPRTVPPKASN